MSQNQENSETNNADISFEVGFRNNKTRFDLRMISIAEEEEIRLKFTDIADSDSEKEEKEYEICLEALTKFSVKLESGFRTKFSDRTVTNERIIRAAYREFRSALTPEVTFL
ncbi:MAG TPA: hypothetical protein VF556_17735 [Pyrinomonadaceae bacterium]|jgi:hypothetical protein